MVVCARFHALLASMRSHPSPSFSCLSLSAASAERVIARTKNQLPKTIASRSESRRSLPYISCCNGTMVWRNSSDFGMLLPDWLVSYCR